MKTVAPILLQSNWIGCSQKIQVVPNGSVPATFAVRLIVGDVQTIDKDVLSLWQSMRGRKEIAALQLFFKKDSLPDSSAPKDLSLLPEAFREELALFSFSGDVQSSFIEKDALPDLPSYPMWVRDVARSRLVVRGDYGEIFPPTYEFVPTLNCIYTCLQCAYREPKKELGIWQRNNFSETYHMTFETMKTLLGMLRENGARNILFTGGGEPLVNVNTPFAMKYAHDVEGLNVALYTNGALLTEKTARVIFSAVPVFVRVSLNAGTAETHAKFHRPRRKDGKIDFFSKTLSGIEWLAKTKRAAGSNTVLGVSYLVHPENVQDILSGSMAIARLARKYRGMINYMRFTPAVNYYGKDQHSKGFFEDALEQTERGVVPLLQDSGVEPLIYFHRFKGLYEPRTYHNCLASSWYGEVGPGGILYHCCEKMLNAQFALGSLLEKPMPELWHGEGRSRVLGLVSRAIEGESSSPCPIVCKPHELNKKFDLIERIRGEGRIDLVSAWLEQIHRIIALHPQQYLPGALDGFQS